MKPSRIVALGVVAIMGILAWQLGGVIKAAVAASVARVSTENINRGPHPDSRPAVSMPSMFVLNLPGGSMICRLGPRAYSCTPDPIRSAVHGARP